MSRPGYVQYYVQDGTPRQQMLDALCRRLGLDNSHRSRIAAIDAAVSAALAFHDVEYMARVGKGEKNEIVNS